MQNFLIVVDMQKDFIDGALGSAEAEAVVPRVRAKIDSFCGRVIYTRDTHDSGYSRTQEGRRLPVAHCIRETKGWQISRELPEGEAYKVIDKPSFGSVELGELLREEDRREPIGQITLVGL